MGRSSFSRSLAVPILAITAFFFSSVEAAAAGTLTSFKPGKDWNDIDGKIIDCHAGNIIYVQGKKTYYWFGEHRGSPSGVACYSSKDLYNWKNEGVALNKATAGLSSGIIERPKVAYNAKTGKYVMWFHYDNSNYGLAHQGVAVCDSAKGPYNLIGHFKPNGNESRDIGMFQDADGKTYIGYAANSGGGVNSEVRLVELDTDYLSVTKNDVVTGAHCEGPALLKWNNTYFLLTSLCSGWDPNKASYYTCNKVLGSYSNKGSPCIPTSESKTFNSQPSSIFKVPGYSNGFIYVGDRWNGSGSTKSQYVFLPINMTSDGKMELKWYDDWDLSKFTPTLTGDEPSHGFKKVVYENVVNKSGLYVLNLLGKHVPCAYQKADSRVLNIIGTGEKRNVPSNGMYIVP
jgi:hypothetical protein